MVFGYPKTSAEVNEITENVKERKREASMLMKKIQDPEYDDKLANKRYSLPTTNPQTNSIDKVPLDKFSK